VKYSALEDQYIFQTIAVESLDPMNCDGCKFFADLGRMISCISGDERENTFLFERQTYYLFAILVQFCFVTQQF